MAIRFTDKPTVAPAAKPDAPKPDDSASVGEARFATPIEAVQPVNPDAASELPFGDLPRAERAERKKRAPKPVTRP